MDGWLTGSKRKFGGDSSAVKGGGSVPAMKDKGGQGPGKRPGGAPEAAAKLGKAASSLDSGAPVEDPLDPADAEGAELCKMAANKRKKTSQMGLDLGQSGAGWIECGVCRMLYVPGNDHAEHRRFHAQALRGVPFNVSPPPKHALLRAALDPVCAHDCAGSPNA